MESVADDIGPETAVRPPKRKPGSVPSTTERPVADAKVTDAKGTDTKGTDGTGTDTTGTDTKGTDGNGSESHWQPEPTRPVVAAQPAPVEPAPAPRPVAAVEPERRYRQTIHRVDLWSVLKIAVCFYICGMAVTMVALVALWLIADAAGVIHSVEKFFGDLLQTKDFTFLDGEILRGALLVSAVLVVLQIVITVIAAAFYNVFAELFGGVEITISEDETAL
jgi:Transmembrane domain of unknown function (DUF3566)